MKRALGAFLALGLLVASGAAQAAPVAGIPTYDLSSCLAAALSAGDDIKLLDRSLAAARSLHAVTAAKAGLSLAASGGYGLAYGLDDATLSKRAGASDGLGLGQSASGSLVLSQGNQSVSSPYTRLSLSLAHSIPPAEAGADAVSSLGLSLAQTLWDGYPGGQTRAAVEKSLLALGAKELSAAQGRSAAASKAKLAYVAMLSAQRALALRKGSLEKQNALLEQMKAVYALEQASAVDLASASINARSAELEVRSGDKELRMARQRLANLMGLASDAIFVVAEVDEPRLPAASLEEAIATGLAKRADAAQLELTRRSAAIDLALARAQSAASFGLTAGVNAVLGWGEAAKSGEAASLGLKLSLPLLDAGSARSQAESILAQLEAYDAQARQLRKTIEADIADYYESALIQNERVGLAKSSMELAQAQFEVVRTQNRFGTATNQDLLSASMAAATAVGAFAAARTAYLTAAIQLETAMGQ